MKSKIDYTLRILEDIQGIKLKPYQKILLRLTHKYGKLSLNNRRKF